MSTKRVPAEDIERIVGAHRHAYLHLGRAVSAESNVYILHSQECLLLSDDLREDCVYSKALEQGIPSSPWIGHEDRPVILKIATRWVQDLGREQLVPIEFPVVL